MNETQKKNLEQLKQGGKEQYELLRKHRLEGGTFKSYLDTLNDAGISFERPVNNVPFYFLFSARVPGDYQLTVFDSEMLPVPIDVSHIPELLDSLDVLLGHQFHFESLKKESERAEYFAQMLDEIKEHDELIRSILYFDHAQKQLDVIQQTILSMQKQILDSKSYVDDEYERGVFNGMETLIAAIEDREPHYLFLVNELDVSVEVESATTLEEPTPDN